MIPCVNYISFSEIAMVNEDSQKTAHDPALNTDITFPTTSDALLASVVFRHNAISPTLAKFFNAVLKAVCNPNFVKDEVTLKTITDIQCYIAEQRDASHNAIIERSYQRSLAVTVHQRSTRNEGSSHSGGLPPVAMDCVFDFLKEILVRQIGEYAAMNNTTDHPLLRQNSHILFGLPFVMTLVHPTWTARARHLMELYVCIVDKYNTGFVKALHMCARNPVLGGSTRMLEIRQGISNLEDVEFLRRVISKRMPHLRILKLRINPWMIAAPTSRSAWGSRLGRMVKELKYIEEIQLFVEKRLEDPMMQSFIQRLSDGMLGNRSLRVFRLFCVSFQPKPLIPGSLASLSRMANLSSVQLNVEGNFTALVSPLHNIGDVEGLEWRRITDSSQSSASEFAIHCVRFSNAHRRWDGTETEFIWHSNKEIIAAAHSLEIPRILSFVSMTQIKEIASSAHKLSISIPSVWSISPHAISILHLLPTTIEKMEFIINLDDNGLLKHILKDERAVEQWAIAVTTFLDSRSCPRLQGMQFVLCDELYSGWDEETMVRAKVCAQVQGALDMCLRMCKRRNISISFTLKLERIGQRSSRWIDAAAGN